MLIKVIGVDLAGGRVGSDRASTPVRRTGGAGHTNACINTSRMCSYHVNNRNSDLNVEAQPSVCECPRELFLFIIRILVTMYYY